MINRLQFVCQGSVFFINDQRSHWMEHGFCILNSFHKHKIRRLVRIGIHQLKTFWFKMVMLKPFHQIQHLSCRINQENMPFPFEYLIGSFQKMVYRLRALTSCYGPVSVRT